MRDYKLTLNLITNNKVENKTFKQYDKGNEIELEVLQNENLDSPEKLVLSDETVLAFFKRKDGVILQKNCTIRDENIIVTTSQDVLSVVGELELECLIHKGDVEVTTQRMYFTVEESISRTEAITQDPNYSSDLVTELLDVKENVYKNTIDLVNAVDSKADTNASNIEALQTSMETANTNISKNTQDIASLTTSMGTANTNIDKNTQDIATNTENIEINTSNITTNTQDINTLKDKTNTSTSSVTLAYNVSLITGYENIIRKKDGYVKLDFGLVTTNSANDWTDGQLLFTLPTGFRPKTRQYRPVFTTRAGSGVVSKVYYIDIYTNGEAHIQLCNGDTAAIYSAYIQDIEFLAT